MGKLTFGNTGLSYQCDRVELNMEGAPKCPRCDQRVYFNEERKGAGKSWHIKCFICSNCNKTLDSSNYNQQGECSLYCTPCYRKLCGPKVYGFVSNACLPTVTDLASGTNGTIYESEINQKPVLSSINSTTSRSSIFEGQMDNCLTCGKRVYFAEEIKVRTRKYHKLCFKCSSCNKILEPGKFNEHGVQLFCKGCYGKHYGPTGYGFSGGNGSMMVSTNFSSQSSCNNEAVGTMNKEFVNNTENGQPSVPIRGIQEWTESYSFQPKRNNY